MYELSQDQQDFIRFLNSSEVTPVRKKPEKRKPNTIPESSYKRFEQAHIQYYELRHPDIIKDGHYPSPKRPDFLSSNGMNRFISDFMDYVGGDGDRQNVFGRRINGIWTPSTTKRGKADMECLHNNGITFHCEVKVGKDTIRPKQLERQAKIRSCNGYYEFIRTPDDFYRIYDYISTLSITKR